MTIAPFSGGSSSSSSGLQPGDETVTSASNGVKLVGKDVRFDGETVPQAEADAMAAVVTQAVSTFMDANPNDPAVTALSDSVSTSAGGGGASSLDDLSDVDTATTAPAVGDLLQFDGNNFVPVAGSNGGASALDDLNDVDTATTAPAVGDLLQFDGNNFVPVAGSNGGASALDDLNDVDTATTAPAVGDLLQFDGNNFVPVAGSNGGGVSDFASLTDTPGNYASSAGQLLVVNPTEDAVEFIDKTATQAEVDAGVVTDKYVTPETLTTTLSNINAPTNPSFYQLSVSGLNSAPTYPSGVAVKVTDWVTPLADPSGSFNAASGEYTAQADLLCSVAIQINSPILNVGIEQTRVYVNGVERAKTAVTDGGQSFNKVFSTIISLVAGDTVSVYFQQTSSPATTQTPSELDKYNWSIMAQTS